MTWALFRPRAREFIRFWGVEFRGFEGVEGVGAFRALGFTAGSTVTCSGNTTIAQGWPFHAANQILQLCCLWDEEGAVAQEDKTFRQNTIHTREGLGFRGLGYNTPREYLSPKLSPFLQKCRASLRVRR